MMKIAALPARIWKKISVPISWILMLFVVVLMGGLFYLGVQPFPQSSQTTGFLELIGLPKDAEIAIDGKYYTLEESRKGIELTPGTHSVSVKFSDGGSEWLTNFDHEVTVVEVQKHDFGIVEEPIDWVFLPIGIGLFVLLFILMMAGGINNRSH